MQPVARRAAPNLDHGLLEPVLERHLRFRKQPRDVEQEPSRNDDRALRVDLRLQRAPQRELHVGRGEPQLPVTRLEQDAGQDLHGCSRRDTPRDDPESVQQLLAGAGRLEGFLSDHSFYFDHL